MHDEDLWFGFLEAKDKSTPVLLDRRLDTANPQTVYLLNLARGAILEYRRDIVEGKLRELTAAEAEVARTLQEAHARLAASFQPRAVLTPAPVAPPPPPKKKRAAVDEVVIDEDADVEMDEELELEDADEDWGDDEE